MKDGNPGCRAGSCEGPLRADERADALGQYCWCIDGSFGANYCRGPVSETILCSPLQYKANQPQIPLTWEKSTQHEGGSSPRQTVS